MLCGADIGSRTVKIVLLAEDAMEVLAARAADLTFDSEACAARLLEQTLEAAGVSRRDVRRTVGTGYGRRGVSFADATVTEITCHARGVRHLVPDARTVVDIGGQDSKLILLDENGAVRDFTMNDRCAAGTGRFLEMVAQRLGLSLEELGRAAQRSGTPAPITNVCAVFAETEIVGLLASGTQVGEIAAGVQRSLATRFASMAGRGVCPPVLLTGGVALINGMDEALTAALGHPVTVSPMPQFTGALGAALLASDS